MGIISRIPGDTATNRGNDDITKVTDILQLINKVIEDGERTGGPDQTRVLSTNAVTKRLGLTARTVRFYSEVGIARPLRRGTTRLFQPEQVRRLELARELRNLGMDVRSVADLLDQLYLPEARQHKLQTLTELFSSHLNYLLHREEEVRKQYHVTTRLAEELFATGKSSAVD